MMQLKIQFCIKILDENFALHCPIIILQAIYKRFLNHVIFSVFEKQSADNG